MRSEMNSNKRKDLNEMLKDTKDDRQILAVFLYGSCARGEDNNKSDIDVCLVLHSGDYTNKELSRKKLEYLKSFDLDVQVFQQLPIYIRVRIIKEGKVLFCKDEDSLYSIVFDTIREFGDFEHIYSNYLKEVSNVR